MTLPDSSPISPVGSRLRKAALPLAWGAAWVLIYGQLVLKDPILERDDKHTLLYLKDWPTLWEFLRSGDYRSFAVYQPFRDLTFHFDLYLKQTWGIGTFHLTNLLIFAALVYTSLRILRRVHGANPFVTALPALMAVHPIFVGSVGWISARKHLLSCLFILLATGSVIALVQAAKFRWRTLFLPVFFYSLSLLSHPINVLWPLWAVAYWGITRPEKGSLPAVALCLPPLLFGAMANLGYYSGLYEVHTSARKLISLSQVDPGIFLLEQGRYLFNFLFPFRLAALYAPGSPWNLVGLAAGAVLLFLVARSPRRREASLWLFFYLLPLSTVAFTNVFVSDTYALASSFALLNLAAVLGSGSRLIGHRCFPAAATGIGVVLAGLSFVQARSWISDSALWAHSYKAEPTTRTLALHADQVLRSGDLKGALALASELRQLDPDAPEYSQIAVRAIYLNTSLPIDARIRLIREFTEKTPWTSYFAGLLHAQKGDYLRAFELVRDGLKSPNAFLTELPVVAAEGMYLCRRSERADCFLFSEEIKIAAFSSNWNEDVYQGHLRELTGP